MEITLIRHGKSLLTDNGRISCADFKKWVGRYNQHGVFEETSYPPATVEAVARVRLIITSDLERAVHSAVILNRPILTISDELFRETELPAPAKRLFDIPLRPSTWAVIFRLLWFCGYSDGCESLRQARVRAEQAARQLDNYANRYQTIALVGHGFFNRLIAKELRKRGWKGSRTTGAKHWSCVTYVR